MKKTLKSHLNCRDLKTINSVFESLIFNLLVTIHRLMSERQLFTFEIAYNGCLNLNEILLSVVSINMITNLMKLQNRAHWQ